MINRNNTIQVNNNTNNNTNIDLNNINPQNVIIEMEDRTQSENTEKLKNIDSVMNKVLNSLYRTPRTNVLPYLLSMVGIAFGTTPFVVLSEPNSNRDIYGLPDTGFNTNLATLITASTGLVLSKIVFDVSNLIKDKNNSHSKKQLEEITKIIEEMKITEKALNDSANNKSVPLDIVKKGFNDVLSELKEVEKASLKQLKENLIEYNTAIRSIIPKEIMEKHQNSQNINARF